MALPDRAGEPHIICVQYARFPLDQIFCFDESFWTPQKGLMPSRKQAREKQARRGSGAVVEAGDSPDLLQYNSRDHEKKSAPLLEFASFPRPEKGNYRLMETPCSISC